LQEAVVKAEEIFVEECQFGLGNVKGIELWAGKAFDYRIEALKA
jgi:hypothetical protein